MSPVVPHGQQWPDCDAATRRRVERVVAAVRGTTGDAYLGIYLHGSLATGCYYPPKSDLDLLVVVTRSLTVTERARTARAIALLEASEHAVGGVELSVITSAVAAAPIRCPPYEVHYSQDWHADIMASSVDWHAERHDVDLNAHLMMTVRRGVAVDGPAVSTVFTEGPWEDYLHAVLADFDWIAANDRLLESPYYGVLNICRTLELLAGGRDPLSKEEGAIWALAALPREHRPIIAQALRAYRSSAPVSRADRATNAESWDTAALRALLEHARAAAQRACNRGA